MILYIIRHAWAVDRDDPACPEDSLRPLTEEGRERFGKLVKVLAERGFAPGLIATSPLVRCRQTAEIVSRQVRGQPAVVERDELAPGSDLAGLLAWTNGQLDRQDEIAWVGHAPDVENLAGDLIGAPRGATRFAKGGVAAIQFDGPAEQGAGTLWWLVTAKLLGC
jgi:phosphohistidine phosphatase